MTMTFTIHVISFPIISSLSATQVLIAVWNVTRVHKDKDEMTKRLAEEIAEGVGKCCGGRIGTIYQIGR